MLWLYFQGFQLVSYHAYHYLLTGVLHLHNCITAPAVSIFVNIQSYHLSGSSHHPHQHPLGYSVFLFFPFLFFQSTDTMVIPGSNHVLVQGANYVSEQSQTDLIQIFFTNIEASSSNHDSSFPINACPSTSN